MGKRPGEQGAFSTEAPQGAARIEEAVGGPADARPVTAGPAIIQPNAHMEQVVARVVDPDTGARIMGTSVQAEAAGDPHIFARRPDGPLAGIVTEGFAELDMAAENVPDSELEVEHFRCTRVCLSFPVTEGVDRYPNGDKMQIPLAFDEMVIKDSMCQTHSVAELTPKYLAYFQRTGIVGAELRKKVRAFVASVILKEKDMLRRPTAYCISARFSPLPKAVDPAEELRKQVRSKAAELGVSPEEFIAGLGKSAPGALDGQGQQHRVVRDMMPADMHRHVAEMQGRGGPITAPTPPQSINVFPQPATT